MSTPAETHVTAAPVAAPSPRPAAFFLQAPGRRLGPLTRDELAGYFGAGLVGADAMIIGPDWDGAVSADVAAERLGVTRRSGTPATPAGAAVPRDPASLPPLPVAPIAYRRAGLGWRLAASWAVALLAVQMAIVPAHELGSQSSLGEFMVAVAWRFALVAVPCLVVFAGLPRLARGLWPSARGPLLAMSAVYALLAVQFALRPAPPSVEAAAPATLATDAAPAPQPQPTPIEAPAWTGFESQASDVPPPPEAAAPVAPVAAAAPASTASPSTPARAANVDPDPWQTQARTLYSAGDWQGLLAHSTAWTQQSPRHKYAWLYLGLANERLHLRAAALAANQQAYALDADDPLIMSNLANTYLDLGQYRQGADVLERLLARSPDSYRALNDYGFAMSRLGEYDDAVEALERAVKIKPDYTLAWQNLINAHSRAGYVDRASDAARRANGQR
jgi:tetratricopeptide (TPR) repeat protein